MLPAAPRGRQRGAGACRGDPPVDPAGRLLEVARATAAARDLDATFAQGDAVALGLGDASADVLLSVFAIIFAPDPTANEDPAAFRVTSRYVVATARRAF